MLSRVFKDIFPRYQTMQGSGRPQGRMGLPRPSSRVDRAEAGFKHKDDIERYGMAEFNQQCRESVLEYIDDWKRLTERIGPWVDTDHSYLTLDITTSSPCGGRRRSGSRTCCSRATASCRTARAAGPR